MRTFTATEREITQPGNPGDQIPMGDFHFLRVMEPSEFYPRAWRYHHMKHTMRDMIRPGYFDEVEMKEHLRVGDEIHMTACGGNKLPSEFERAILIVEERPNVRERPVIVAILHRWKKATPVRHDGEAVVDDKPTPKAA